MRFSIPTVLLAVVSVATSRHILQARQDATPSIAALAEETPSITASNVATQAASSSIFPSASTRSVEATADSIDPTSRPNTVTAGTRTSLVPGSNPSSASSTTSSPRPTSGNSESLPIDPKITPAIGFAGALLLLTGLAYGLTGIRNKWLYTFFGLAYPVSLSFLVLIVYCMNPPVSDAIQGAYLVAVVIGGCFFGGLGLVFWNLADGFGCPLGGFCMGMWLLTLKEGGLITSSTGRVIFIASFTGVVGLTGMSHYTRRYGLIVTIPFSGATATILGIDCFSKAGLKEFWLYLWNLNANAFPLHTDTYPITRGMKVESAGIIILFVLGLLSELKLWKAIQERREDPESGWLRPRKSSKRGCAGADLDKRESGAGVSYPDSSATNLVANVPTETADKKGVSVTERPVSGVETSDTTRACSTATAVQPADEAQGLQPVDAEGKRLSSGQTSSDTRVNTVLNSPDLQEPAEDAGKDVDESRVLLCPPAPDVVPLPFAVSGIEATAPSSHYPPTAIEVEHKSPRRSGAQRSSWLSWGRSSLPSSPVQDIEACHTLAAADDDNASSIAATMDDIDGDDIMLSTITFPQTYTCDELSLSLPEAYNHALVAPSLESGDKSPVTSSTAIKQHDLTHHEYDPRVSADGDNGPALECFAAAGGLQSAQEGPALANMQIMPRSVVGAEPGQPDTRHEQALASTSQGSRSKGSSQRSGHSSTERSRPLTRNSLTEQSSDAMTKVALQYRTNEWAKHISVAEEPQEDAFDRPPSPGVRINTIMSEAHEHVVRSPVVDPDHYALPKPTPKRASTDPTTSQTVQALRRQQAQQEALAKLSSGPRPVQQQTSTMPSSNRQNLGSSTLSRSGPAGARGSRIVSSPMFGQTITESPTEGSPIGDLRLSASKQDAPRASPMSPAPPARGSTLLEERERRLSVMPRTRSFQVLPSDPSPISPTPDPNIRVTSPSAASARNIDPIAARSSTALSTHQSQQFQTPPTTRQASWTQQPILTSDLKDFNSHQPDRRSAADQLADQQKRDHRFTEWRTSLREDQVLSRASPRPAQRLATVQPTTALAEHAHRASILNEKREQEIRQEQQKLRRDERAQAIMRQMQSGEWEDQHRVALAKMQAMSKMK